jgi:hypothetical protein
VFNLINFEVKYRPVNLGPQVTGLVVSGGGDAAPYMDGARQPADLPVPWREKLQADPDVFSLLQWRTRMSDFGGRAAEMAALKEWATSDRQFSATFVTGDGGTGKTRLAAELATELREDEWAAGFPDLKEPGVYAANEAGTLLIVDYPEEHPDGLRDLFGKLAALEEGDGARLRILFLSRREQDAWRDLAEETRAAAIFDWKPVHLGPLAGEAAYDAFHSAFEKISEAKDTDIRPVPLDGFLEWLETAPENDRAPFYRRRRRPLRAQPGYGAPGRIQGARRDVVPGPA